LRHVVPPLGGIFVLRPFHLKAWLHASQDALLTFFYPTFCRVCGAIVESRRDGIACEDCWLEVRQSESNALTGDDTAIFSYSSACGPYRGPWRETVLHLKKAPVIAARVRTTLTERLQASDIRFDCVVPVPLHSSRERERGFNQAAVIARAIASSTGIRLNEASVVRAKATLPHRAGTSAKDREKSLRGAFRVVAPRLISSRTVLLVDDVMTTGVTAREAATTLLASGASAVGFLAISRVMRESEGM
jgi:ComF family protein